MPPFLPPPAWKRICLGLLLACLAAGPAGAANRVLLIAAPALAAPGTRINVSVFASTNAGGGEQIGFFHGEYSLDDGRTWTAFCFEENAGSSATRLASFTTGAAGSRIFVRVRIAYRGGPAGDVDFNGAPINWAGSWIKWQEPPAKITTTTVVAS